MYSAVTPLVLTVLLLNSSENPANAITANADEPAIVGDIANISTTLGATASIDCTVRNKGSYRLYWMQLDFDNSVLISSDEEVQVINPAYPDNTTKYDVIKTINGSLLTYRLTIQKLVDIDAGRYQCAIVINQDSSTWPSAVGTINIADVCHTCPRIVGEIGSVVGRVNNSGILSCIVSNKGNNLVRWKKDSGNIEISSDTTIVVDNPSVDGSLKKYEILTDDPTSGKRYRLKMNRLTVQDSGTYRCYVEVSGQTNPFKTGNFTTQVPPTISSSASTFTKQEGQSVTMSCTTDGIPTPSILWSRKDGTQISQGPSLTIQNISREHRGYYTCTSANGVAPDAESIITLYVLFNPTARSETAEIFQAIGFDVELACLIEGYPVATPTWYKGSGADRVALKDGEKYAITNTEGDGIYQPLDQVRTSIRINDLTKADFGEYTCEGENHSGAANSATVILTESDHCIGLGCVFTHPTPSVTKDPGSSQCTGSHCTSVSVRSPSSVSVISSVTTLVCMKVFANLLN